MGIKTTRKLLCKLTEDEIDERGRKAADLDQEKRKVDAERKATASTFREQIKHLDKQIADLTEQATTGEELREVECEERESLVSGGGLEIVRLDTLEVVDTIPDDPEDDAPSDQPRLPFSAARPAPELRCTAIDADGVPYLITAEQADAADRQIAEQGHAMVAVDRDGPHVRVEKIVRGRACEFCGQADGNHRQPECDDAKREAAGEFAAEHGLESATLEDDDRNDTSDLAMRLAESPLPSDEPLVPNEPSARAPRKSSKASKTSEVH